MGIDYSFRLAVGFRVTRQMLEQRFARHIAAKIKLEDRYDPKTGKRLEPVEVVVKDASHSFVWGAVELEDPMELVDAICDKIGATYWSVGSYMDGDVDYIIGPSFKTSEGMDCGRIDCGGGVDYLDMLGMGPEVSRIGIALLELDLDVSVKAEVTIAWTIC